MPATVSKAEPGKSWRRGFLVQPLFRLSMGLSQESGGEPRFSKTDHAPGHVRKLVTQAGLPLVIVRI